MRSVKPQSLKSLHFVPDCELQVTRVSLLVLAAISLLLLLAVLLSITPYGQYSMANPSPPDFLDIMVTGLLMLVVWLIFRAKARNGHNNSAS
jgi:hypothetical protein